MVFGFLTSFSHTGYYLNVLLWLWKIGGRLRELLSAAAVERNIVVLKTSRLSLSRRETAYGGV